MIATYDRLETIKMTIDSLLGNAYSNISIHLIVDGNNGTYASLKEFCKGKSGDIRLYANEERKDVIYSYNKALKEMDGGCVLFASDDLVFHRDCIVTALRAMRHYFSDTDGIIGFNQLQRGESKGRKYAFGLIGERFMDRFPGRIIFCPDYIHFNGDRELGIYSKEINKLYFCEDAKLDHIRLQDETTKLGKQVYMQDKLIFRTRQKKQFLWGKNFRLLREQ